MSAHRRQAYLEAPLATVWNLVGNPHRHPEWWPRVVEVDGTSFDEGENYAQVTRSPLGRRATTMHIDRLDDLREIEMTCQTTGTHVHWTLTEAEGGTFVELELGVDPKGTAERVLDSIIGPRYFRRWTDDSLAGLRAASDPD